MTRNLALFAGVGLLFILTGMFQSWNLALSILNLSLISAIMALGVNIQWGYAGLFNTGIMGFAALGGLAVVLVSTKPVVEGWDAGGPGVLLGLFLGAASILLLITRKMLIVWALVLSSLLGGCFSRALKLTLDVPRPAALMHEDLFIIGEKLTHGSMPSGHSMTIAIVFGLFLGLYHRFNPKAQRLGLPLAALVALVCLARVASGAHWPADVFMGAGLGILIGCVSALIILRWESSLPRYEALNDGCRLLIASALVLVPLPPSCSL